MSNSISGASQVPSSVPTSAVQGAKSADEGTERTIAPANSKAAAPKSDSVQLSSVAQAAIAALKEAAETPAQTAKEASGGDVVAQRLLAKQSSNR